MIGLSNGLKDFVRRTRARALRARTGHLPELDLMGRRVLIVAPHPDDEALGCGGLIARLCAAGCAPEVVILTRGEGSHAGCCDISGEDIARARAELTSKAARHLGLREARISRLWYSDGGVPASDLSGQLARIVGAMKVKPEVVLVPHRGEGWPDHLNAAALAREALSVNDICAEVYEYCVWMWYYNVRNPDWKNGFKVRMSSEEYAAKLAAAREYILPEAPCGRPWSGKLPAPFVEAVTAPIELYFKS